MSRSWLKHKAFALPGSRGAALAAATAAPAPPPPAALDAVAAGVTEDDHGALPCAPEGIVIPTISNKDGVLNMMVPFVAVCPSARLAAFFTLELLQRAQSNHQSHSDSAPAFAARMLRLAITAARPVGVFCPVHALQPARAQPCTGPDCGPSRGGKGVLLDCFAQTA